MTINLYDVVVLLVDAMGVKAGSTGTVIEIYNDGQGFEVEFLDDDGYVSNCITLSKEQISKLENN